MFDTPFLVLFTETAAKAAVLKAVTSLLDHVGVLARFSLKDLKSSAAIDRIHEHLWSVRNVKTLWQDDRNIPLKEIYHHVPVFVPKFGRHTGTKLRRTKIHKLEDFGVGNKNILIEGTVGQGKSMLLRFLALTELFSGGKFPVFIELRCVSWSNDDKKVLQNSILHHFIKLGVSIRVEHLTKLARTGRITLFLDGFDEVSRDQQKKALVEIDAMCETYPNLQVVVTSRPEGGCRKSPHFRPFKMCTLKPKDVGAIIEKSCGEIQDCDELRKQFAESPEAVKSIVTTPLMVGQLIRHFLFKREIPKTKAEFYRGLFRLHFRDIDATKPGFHRSQRSSLDYPQLHRVFCQLCYEIRSRGEYVVSDIKAYEFVRESLSNTSHRGQSSEEVIDDIVTITALMQRSGSDLLFPHKSIAEFHSARHVESQNLDFRKSFYAKMLSQGDYMSWPAPLKYLRELDRDIYQRHFELPALATLAVHEEPNSREDQLAVFDDLFFVDIENGLFRNNGAGARTTLYALLFDEDMYLPDSITEKMIAREALLASWHRIPRLNPEDSDKKLILLPTLVRIGAITEFGFQVYMDRIRKVHDRLRRARHVE